jgi:8-oxo-dGTP diphosphatase
MSEERRYPARPWPAIGVIVWRGDETLIIRRGKPPGEGQWGLIGGVMETGETYFEAAMREAREEAGITIEPFGIVTAIDGITKDAGQKIEFHYSIVEVNARHRGGAAVAQSDAKAVRWVTMAELERLDVWSEMLRVVKLAHAQYKAGTL